MQIRLARESDVDGALELIAQWAKQDQLLPRTRASLAALLGSLIVAVDAERVVGVVALQALEPLVSEVRSLAVMPGWQGGGIGRALVGYALGLAEDRGLSKVICFTRQVDFFLRCGFSITETKLPAKYYLDCIGCPKLAHCDETAMEWVPVANTVVRPKLPQTASHSTGS